MQYKYVLESIAVNMTTYEFRFLSVFIPINIINSINYLYNFYLHLYGKMFSKISSFMDGSFHLAV